MTDLIETKTKCPCCGETMVDEYDICVVCNWENDPVQSFKPELRGGANIMSLNEARRAYKDRKEIR